MLRVSDATREQVQRLAREEFGGASADETIRRLLDEHWEAAALAAVERYRTDNPQGWADYLAEAENLTAADAPITDESVAELSRPPIQPGSVWFCDLEPVRGREQGKDRPALVVSSAFHLQLTGGALVSVLPLTSVERLGWLHRVPVGDGGGWVITEQVRTLAVQRFRRPASEIALSDDGLAEVRRVLAKMLLISV